MGTKDYFLLLESAKSHLEDIKRLEQKLPNNDHLHIKISQKIRYFSIDIQSSLDFIAYDFFELYSQPIFLEHGNTEEEINSKKEFVSFPFNRKPKTFNKQLKNFFPQLEVNYPEIFKSIKNIQPFIDSNDEEHWLYQVNDIANKNKHRYLTKTLKIQNGFIEHFEYEGITLTNYSFKLVGTAINIMGKTLTPEIANQIGAEFTGEIETISVFSDNEKAVTETLEYILENASTLISKLSETFQTLE